MGLEPHGDEIVSISTYES